MYKYSILKWIWNYNICVGVAFYYSILSIAFQNIALILKIIIINQYEW